MSVHTHTKKGIGGLRTSSGSKQEHHRKVSKLARGQDLQPVMGFFRKPAPLALSNAKQLEHKTFLRSLVTSAQHVVFLTAAPRLVSSASVACDKLRFFLRNKILAVQGVRRHHSDLGARQKPCKVLQSAKSRSQWADIAPMSGTTWEQRVEWQQGVPINCRRTTRTAHQLAKRCVRGTAWCESSQAAERHHPRARFVPDAGKDTMAEAARQPNKGENSPKGKVSCLQCQKGAQKQEQNVA